MSSNFLVGNDRCPHCFAHHPSGYDCRSAFKRHMSTMTHPSSPPAPMTAEDLRVLCMKFAGGALTIPETADLFRHIGALTARIAELERERDEAKARAREPVTERDVEAMRRQLLLVGYEGAAKVLHDLLGRAHAAERELTTLQEITGGILTRAALIARAEALEAELAAARKVEDGEVAQMAAALRADCNCADNVDAEQQYDGTWVGSFSRCTSCKSADLLTRLSAALKEAERQVVDWTVRTGRQVERADKAEARAQAAEAQLKEVRKHSREAYDHLCSNAIESVRRSRAMELLRLVIALQTKDTTE